MNVWRWLGLFFFLAAVTCMVGTRLPAFAGDKDKKVETKDKKADEKDKKAETKDKKADDKDKKPETKDKKADDKDKKPEPPKGSNGAPKFTAFGPKSPVFYQEVTTKTVQDMKVMGQDVQQTQEQTFYIKWTPAKDLDKQGNYVVEQQVVAIKMKIDIGGNKIAFDSTLPAAKQPKNPMTDFFKALMDQKLTFTITPAMVVTEIGGREAFIKSLSETNPAIKTLLDTIMSDAALKKMAEPTWWAVPQKTTAGESWPGESKLDLGPIGIYDTTFKFTYEGKTNNLDTVKINADLKYTAPPKDKTGLPFTIKDATLSGSSESGEALFNRDKGRIESSKLVMKIKGDLKIEVGNVVTEINLEQKQTSSTQTFDKLPPEAETTKK
jgi:hypothetical protein